MSKRYIVKDKFGPGRQVFDNIEPGARSLPESIGTDGYRHTNIPMASWECSQFHFMEEHDLTYQGSITCEYHIEEVDDATT